MTEEKIRNICIPDIERSIFIIKRNTKTANVYYRNTLQFLMAILPENELEFIIEDSKYLKMSLEEYIVKMVPNLI